MAPFSGVSAREAELVIDLASSRTPASPAVHAAMSDSLAFAQTSLPQSPDADDLGLRKRNISTNPAHVPAEAPPVLAGFLVSYDANPLGQSWIVHQGSNEIGRVGAGADADIEFPHATVSSRHAIILATALPGRMLLIDQASTNGTFVNDVALQPDQQWPLQDGDTVRFGLFSVHVKIVL